MIYGNATFSEEYETNSTVIKDMVKAVLQITNAPQVTTQELEQSTENVTLNNFTVTSNLQPYTTLPDVENMTIISDCHPAIVVTNCSMHNNTHWFIHANSHHSVYTFVGVILGIFFLVMLVVIVLYLKHKRQVFRSRYGEYKLTTVRSINSNSHEDNENEAVSKH